MPARGAVGRRAMLPRHQRRANFKNLAPRFSAVYDLFGNGSTALKVSSQPVHNVGVGTALLSGINPIRVTNDTRPWTRSERRWDPAVNELGPSTGFNLGTTKPLPQRPEAAVFERILIELQHKLPGISSSRLRIPIAIRATTSVRKHRGSRRYVHPAAVTEQTSGRAVTVYNQAPALRGKFDTLFDKLSWPRHDV